MTPILSEPPKRRSSIVRIFLRTLLALFLLLIIAGGWVGWKAYQLIAIPVGGSLTLVDIPDGSGVKQIGAILEEENIIASAYAFEWYVWFQKWGAELKAGQYKFDPSKALPAIAQQLREGGSESQEYQVTIPEGLKRTEIADLIAKKGYISAAEFLEATKQISPEMRIALKIEDAPVDATLEGFLFPETYRFFKSATAEDVVERLVSQFQAEMTTEVREAIEASGRSLYETVTLASIVESETHDADDQPKVASVFLNRLDIGMKLESDVTVLYALDKRDPTVTYEDLSVESPYNTYKYGGLIPAPISNPGITAITAVASPAETDFLFFVADIKTGKTYYSKTFEEHSALVRKYIEQ